MYAEELKHKPIGTAAGIFLTLGIVFALLVSVVLVSALQLWLGAYWPQFVLYGLAIAAVVLIVKYAIMEYIYLIERDRITFGRRLGRKEKELLFIPFREIVSFGPYESMRGRIAGKRRFKYTFKKKAEWFVIECTGCVVILTATDEYFDCLAKATGKKGGK